MKQIILAVFLFGSLITNVWAQHSTAREWNEALLFAIRNDFARPTVHARNLFHISAVMYDAWSIHQGVSEPYLLGKNLHGFQSGFDRSFRSEGLPDEAISYAAYRMIRHRFMFSPGANDTFLYINELMARLGYDTGITSVDYKSGSKAALGNYIASQYIAFGLQDGSNEITGYSNRNYLPVNLPLLPTEPGNPDLVDPNRWQPLSLETFIDQSGNEIPGSSPPFLSPEWGLVSPFALTEKDLTIYNRDEFDYWVYHDPGTPPMLSVSADGPENEYFKWTFALVSVWGGHHDPSDEVMWDISPASIGNSPHLPQTWEEYPQFYDLKGGGFRGLGHAINPSTGMPYEHQLVPRGDYARVLAEFWADGPDSETPPGHWFTILNYVTDHPQFERKYKGEGETLDLLEWEIKAYFTLGGAMHDAAVSAWGVKGWYDYIRPISAIRWMAQNGQSSDPDRPSYHVNGIPLIEDYIDIVEAGDPLAGDNGENIGKIKLFTWRGHEFILDLDTDAAGCDWILADHWWPYQRPSFVTPPFAGYVSGHSTFSRTAADVMTYITGDEFFPGGMGEFPAAKNEFLVFENGPSQDITLQWATYRDASDQCSLSRIWGGIHPPADDIKGREMGIKIAADATSLADKHFNGRVTGLSSRVAKPFQLYPNPVPQNEFITLTGNQSNQAVFKIINVSGQVMKIWQQNLDSSGAKIEINDLKPGYYILSVKTSEHYQNIRFIVSE